MQPAGLAINGRFLGAAQTGVQRVATGLLRQLAHHREELAALFGGPPRILAPRDVPASACPPDWPADWPFTNASRLTGQAWEQFELPLRARGAVLLGLCNLSPVLAPRFGIAAVTMLHDAQVWTSPSSYSPGFRALYRFVQPRIGHSAARILTVSAHSAGELAWHGIADPQRIRVIHNGIDHAAAPDPAILARLGLAPGSYAVALASTMAHKNIRVLLEALAVDPPCRLVLFGSTGAEAFAAARLALGPHVVLAGRVSDGELAALLGQALCFAMPSLTEGFGLPALEAMAQGCPVIAAPCGALPEVCGDAALQAPAHDPDAWRAAIDRLAADPVLRADLATRGRARAARFTWAAAGEALMAALREVATSRTQP